MEKGTKGLTMKKIITKNLIARSKAKGLHGEFQGNRSRWRFAIVTKQEESWLQGKCGDDFIQLLFVLREIYQERICKKLVYFFFTKKCCLNVFVEMHE
jgi:hypothetical protein